MFSNQANNYTNAINGELFNTTSFYYECLDIVYFTNCTTCPVIVLTDDIEKQLDKISLWPNPTNAKFNIDISSIKGNLINVKLFDYLGTIIKNKSIKNLASTVELDIKDLPNGIYICQITSDKHKIYSKIIKH